MLLAQHNEVVAVDIIPEKIEMLNRGKSPIVDVEISDFLDNKELNFTATLEKKLLIQGLITSLSPRLPIMIPKLITLIPHRLNP